MKHGTDIFTKAGRFSRAWDFYNSLPENLKADDRICLSIALSSLKMEQWDFLENQFTKDFAGLHEGDTVLLDIWYNVQAIRLAKQRGETDFHHLLEEVKITMIPPYSLDFRMVNTLREK